MSFMTSPQMLNLRGFTRKLGLNRIIESWFRSDSYEKRYGAALTGAVEEGFCIWDVGANIGLYSTKFAELVGRTGKVYAFEPSAQNLAQLENTVATLPNVTILPVGLSSTTTQFRFRQGDDAIGATSRVLGEEESIKDEVLIDVTTGDEIVVQSRAELPDFIKIDTEGHEFEVLEGMATTIADKKVRHIFIEVHFSILEELGKSDVPRKIEEFLERLGFQICWTDPSHLHARRGSLA